MIVTHYGRLGSAGEEGMPSQNAEMHAAHFSQTRAMHQLRGYYSTGPSRTQSPQYGSGAEGRAPGCGLRHVPWARWPVGWQAAHCNASAAAPCPDVCPHCISC